MRSCAGAAGALLMARDGSTLAHLGLAATLVSCGAPPEVPPEVPPSSPSSSEPAPAPQPVEEPVQLPPDDGAPIVLAEHEDNGIKFSIESRQKSWLLGDHIVLYYVVENVGAQKKVDVAFGGDYRGGARAERVLFTAIGPDGKPLADPYPEGMNFGGLGATYSLDVGESFVFTIPTHRYRWFEQAGTHTVRIAHDLGWTKEGETVDSEDPRWVEASMDLASPTTAQARAVVARMRSRSSDPNNSAGKHAPAYADFSSLVFPGYLPLLEEIAIEEPRAFAGLGRIATPDATKTLIRLGSHESPEVSRAALEALERRTPNPGAKYPPMKVAERDRLIAGGWDAAALGPALRTLSLELLGDADEERVILGARLLAAAVVAKDVDIVIEALSSALEATKSSPIPYPEPRTPVSALMGTVTVLLDGGAKPPTAPKTPGEIATYLLAHAGAKSKPPGYTGFVADWLEHPIPQIRVLTLRQHSEPLGASASAKLPGLLGADHLGVQNAACKALTQAGKNSAVHDVVRVQMAAATDRWLVSCLNAAAVAVGIPRDEIARIWVDRLDEMPHTMMIFEQLLAFVDSKQHGMSGTPDAAEAERLKKAWAVWVSTHAADLRAGKKFTPGGPEFSKDLVPKGFNFTFADGKPWP